MMSILRTLVVGVHIHMFFPECQCSVWIVRCQGRGFQGGVDITAEQVRKCSTGSIRGRGVHYTWHLHPRRFRSGEITGREANHKGSTTVTRGR